MQHQIRNVKRFPKLKPLNTILLAAFAGFFVPQTTWAESKAEALTTEKIEVISTTPLQGIGLPLQQIPASVQSVKEEQLKEQKSISISDYINQIGRASCRERV